MYQPPEVGGEAGEGVVGGEAENGGGEGGEGEAEAVSTQGALPQTSPDSMMPRFSLSKASCRNSCCLNDR